MEQILVEPADRERAKRYFANPSRYIRNNPYVDLRSQAVRRMLPSSPGRSMLDLGCGDGRVSLPLLGDTDKLLLVDASQGMLELAARNVPAEAVARVEIRCTDVAAFEPPNRFDAVLCIGLLAHVPDIAATLRLVASCVAPGGCALLQLTDDSYFFGRVAHWTGALHRRFVQPSAHIPNHMTLEQVRAEMAGLGFELTSSYRYADVPGVRLLPPAMTRAIVGRADRRPLSSYGGEVLALFSPRQ
jgi:cyclopropane fatty-acyl-phospholipid synthase-like methyltransferase